MNRLPLSYAIWETPGGSAVLLLPLAYPKAPEVVKQCSLKLVMKHYKTYEA